MKTLQDEIGWDDQKYNETKDKIEEICLLKNGCLAKELPELCGYFRRLMREVFKPEQND